MKALNNPQGKTSKTKIGIALLALVPVIQTVAKMLLGDMDLLPGVTALITLSGAVFTAFGIRDIFKK